ncbi:alpha/beta hydrolase domain-containing protein [Clostridium magnum]|uniref:Alpha/beta hydrolase domain-containing protein n=1 Tax=Clostridium magnum DSM 2767 TaxID=1121326 RepID=A0A162QY38_9CLOT|nr:alpha/beta hydrolase domain-containing protein [Clostridium magnum]KZL89135.1 hypothetical protein CLMAG_56210 [Clostridium magnum DSM 2767]SHI03507.1 hypothetical protein SAMN02745944_02168 [Clostridium magnum DSM 2767]
MCKLLNGGFIDKNGRTDDEIIIEFAKALTVDHNAKKMLGNVNWRYITGFSDSSDPVLRLIASGHAKKVFDLALPFIAEGHEPQAALCNDLYDGKLIVLNSEFEDSVSFIDRGRFPNQYRSYAVAGTGHVPDHLVVPSPASGSTPASFSPELRAHFLQGDDWVMGRKKMPLSTHLKRSDNGRIKRDINGNAITVNAAMKPLSRLPFIELGEAHFITGFIGSYEDVKNINELGFKNHHAYVKVFKDKLHDYIKAGYILKNDADDMLRRATLCPKLTFTETYRDHYDNFIAIVSCV